MHPRNDSADIPPQRAVLKDRSKELYAIQFYNLANRVFTEAPGDQEGLADRTKQREYGRLFAQLLARKEIAPPSGYRAVRFPKIKDAPRLPEATIPRLTVAPDIVDAPGVGMPGRKQIRVNVEQRGWPF
jgi:hypothetical protein